MAVVRGTMRRVLLLLACLRSTVALDLVNRRVLARRVVVAGGAAALPASVSATPPLDCNSFGCRPAGGTPPPVVTTTSSARALRVADALKKRGVEFYGAYWCRFCDEQRKVLGSAALERINYVECDVGGAGGDPALCAAAKVEAYPSWATPDGKIYSGVRSLEQLEVLAGLRTEPAAPKKPSGPQKGPPVVGQSSPEAVRLAAALADAGAVFYGTYWCPFCDQQRQLFGKRALAKVPAVECDPRGAGFKGPCAGITSYPTWVIGGRQLSGLQSLDALDFALKAGAPATAAAAAADKIGGAPPAAKPAAGQGGAAGADCDDCRVS